MTAVYDFFKNNILNTSSQIDELIELIGIDSQKNILKYYDSQDFQLADISYEYDIVSDKLSKNITRFSYFGSDIDFLQIIKTFGFGDSILKFNSKYNLYKDFLKDNHIMYSFSFVDGILDDLKIYFDINQNPNIEFNKFDKLILDKCHFKVLLFAFTLKKEDITDEKIYFPVNSYINILSDGLLRNNNDFAFYKDKKPFDILFRFKKEKLNSLKYYYSLNENPWLEGIIDKYFESYKYLGQDFNIKQELGVDFNLKKGINKINYYISYYK